MSALVMTPPAPGVCTPGAVLGQTPSAQLSSSGAVSSPSAGLPASAPPRTTPFSSAANSSSKDSNIVFPPADLRGIIEKTAQFVAKNGVEFEQRVRREQNNQRFAFLLPNNPYNAYYQLKVREFRTGEEAPRPQVPQAILDMRRREEEEKKRRERVLMLTQYGEELGGTQKKCEPPPPDVYTIAQPYIAPIDVDIIQTTAQFVARNGQRFLSGLAQRERQNPQFEFLKPNHALFQYFTNLVDAYTKCLLPPAEQTAKLKEISSSTQKALARCVQRFMWEAEQEKQRKEKDVKEAEERALMRAIDWHDFYIVETIDITEEDDLLPLAAPIDFSASGKRPQPSSLLAFDEVEEEAENLAGAAEPAKQPQSIAALIREAADAAGGVEDEDEMDMEDTNRERVAPYTEKPQVQLPPKSTVQQPTPAVVPPSAGAPPSDAPETLQPSTKATAPAGVAVEKGDSEKIASTEEEEPIVPPAVTGKPPAARIVKGYVRQPRKRGVGAAGVAAGAAGGEQLRKGLQKCPITGQVVPADQMSQHLRILLLDPKWKEQKERFLEKAKAESAFAPMGDVEGNLALFVAKRPDLFGSVDEQVVVEDTTVTGNFPGSTQNAGDSSSGGRAGAPAAAGPLLPTPPPLLSAPLHATSVPPPTAKRYRSSAEEAAAALPTTGGTFVLTVECLGGNGLDDQELQVEVNSHVTIEALKESLLEAGVGREGLEPANVVLKVAATGAVMADRRTLESYGLGRGQGEKVVLSSLM